MQPYMIMNDSFFELSSKQCRLLNESGNLGGLPDYGANGRLEMRDNQLRSPVMQGGEIWELWGKEKYPQDGNEQSESDSLEFKNYHCYHYYKTLLRVF
jgi:hypothetical protein